MKFRGRAFASRLKLPENIHEDKDEGYDGHLLWNRKSHKLRRVMREFRDNVRSKNAGYIREVLDSMGVTGAPAESLVELLLVGEVEQLKEALMSGITIGNRPLVEFILQLFSEQSHEERSGCTASEAYPPHITPLMLACILNNFAIVECLLLRGHSIQPPHHKSCNCEICLRMPYAALASMQKVDILRALCSDAYLWLGTSDPFAAACAMSSDLDELIRDDNLEFTQWYRSLRVSVQQFGARIVDQNWTEQELDMFLAHKCYSPWIVCEDPYPRVQMALDCEMRDVVASTNVQRAMDEMWWRGWGNFGATASRDAFRIFRQGVVYPVLALLYIFSIGKLCKSFDVPLARYISNLASYISFLFTMMLVRWLKKDTDMDPEWNKWLCFWLESYFYLYVVGMLVERYLLFTRHGFRNYFQLWWRWFDVLLIGVLLLALHLWLTQQILPVEPELERLERNHMPSYNQFLLYDIYMSTGCILAIWKIFYYFQLIKGIGASVISVGRCVSCITNYLIIMAVIMLSFAVGLNMLVQPYLGSVETGKDGRETSMGDHFKSIGSAYRNLYWAYYGYLDPQVYPIVVGNSGPERERTKHEITSFAAEMLMAVFHIIIIITLLNLMISLMVKKAEEVLENEEQEFKFTRVIIYSEFLHWSSAVPPPFNLLHILVYILSRPCSGYVFSWPEIFIHKDIIYPDMDRGSRECGLYQGLILKALGRYQSCREHHYKTIYRTEFDAKGRPVQLPAKVAFMTDFSGELERRKKGRRRGNSRLKIREDVNLEKEIAGKKREVGNPPLNNMSQRDGNNNNNCKKRKLEESERERFGQQEMHTQRELESPREVSTQRELAGVVKDNNNNNQMVSKETGRSNKSPTKIRSA